MVVVTQLILKYHINVHVVTVVTQLIFKYHINVRVQEQAYLLTSCELEYRDIFMVINVNRPISALFLIHPQGRCGGATAQRWTIVTQ